MLIVDNIRIMYRHVKTDAEGWALFKDFTPLFYDLVEVITKDNKQYKAWYDGRSWCGYKFKRDLKVEKWRRVFHER